jgi:hypothetical protein
MRLRGDDERVSALAPVVGSDEEEPVEMAEPTAESVPEAEPTPPVD